MSDDIHHDDEDAVTLIDFETEFAFIRVVENTLLPSHIKLKAEVVPSGEHSTDDFDVAISKIRFWFENIVSRCVAFSRSNPNAVAMLIDKDGRNQSGNLLMLCPDEPSDEHLGALFQAKMNALAAGSLHFGSVTVRSDNVTGLVFTFVGIAEDLLPEMPNWVGDRSYFDAPWWGRDDASTMDVIPGPDADLSKPPAWAYSLDFIGKMVKPDQNVVIRPEFRPTVIDGGKRDD